MVCPDTGSYGRVIHAALDGQPAVLAGWLQVTAAEPVVVVALPVAVNVIGLPLRLPEEAVTILAPGVVPSVRSAEAMPLVPVTVVVALRFPPPAVTANV